MEYFSWDDCNTQWELNTKVMQNLGDGEDKQYVVMGEVWTANGIRGRHLNLSRDRFLKIYDKYKTIMSTSFLFYSSTPRIISGWKKKSICKNSISILALFMCVFSNHTPIILHKDMGRNAGLFPAQGLVIEPS